MGLSVTRAPKGDAPVVELPRWIVDSPSFQVMRRELQWTFVLIASSCRSMLQDGSLVGAFGGVQLAEQCGISLRTLWRHVRLLERLGFVVPIKIKTTSDPGGTHYGIPATQGALERFKLVRVCRRMVRRTDGKWQPLDTPPGEQSTIWAEDLDPPGPVPPCQVDTGTRVTVTRPPCQVDTAHHDYDLINNHDHEGLRLGSGPDAELTQPSMRHVRIQDLEDDDRLGELYADAQHRGYLGQSEVWWLRFVTMAEHVLRLRKSLRNPAGVFASNVRKGRWMIPSQADEDAARARIRATDIPVPGGTECPEHAPEAVSPPEHSQAGLSPDAMFVAECMRRVRGGVSYDSMARWLPMGWDRARWDRAMAEAMRQGQSGTWARRPQADDLLRVLPAPRSEACPREHSDP